MTLPSVPSGQFTTEGFSGTGPHEVTTLTGLTTGNMLVLVTVVDGSAIIDLTGGGDLDDQLANIDQGDVSLRIAWRDITGSDPSALTIDHDGGIEIVSTLQYEVQNAADPSVTPPIQFSATGSSTTPDPPDHTTGGGAADYLFMAIAGVDRRAVTGFPANMTAGSVEVNLSPGGANDVSVAGDTHQLATGDGTFNPDTFNIGAIADAWCTATLRFAPVAGDDHTLDPNDIAHSHALDQGTLTQNHVLPTDELSNAHALDQTSIIQNHVLAIDDLANAHALDQSGLTQNHELGAVDDLAHAHALDQAVLTQNHVLALNDVGHAHALDTVALTQDHVLTTDDIAHAHTLDQTTVALNVDLGSTDSIDHAHALDQTTLTQNHVLQPNDLSHAHVLDQAVLTQDHVLAIDDLASAHVLDQAALTQNHVLAVNDLGHGHNLEQAVVSQIYVLPANDITHIHALDQTTVTETGDVVFTVNDLAHAHALDSAQLISGPRIALDTKRPRSGYTTIRRDVA